MSTQNERPTKLSQSARGVFSADPFNPPVPPPGALGAEFRDGDGNLIAWAWIAREHAGPRYFEEAWEWLEAHAPERANDRHLKLVVVDPAR